MKACPEYREYVYLDVLGELPPEKKRQWEEHLSGCPHCREERETTVRFLKGLETNAPRPLLSPHEAMAIREKVSRTISRETHWSSLRHTFSKKVALLIPIAAAACLFLVSVFALHTWWSGRAPKMASNTTVQVEQKARLEDMEIIKNLDLLEQMDTLRVLVKVVDNKDII
ncbi:MAG: zf-HC2 domain-containing protein [Deltaproteobacteria bacterium]|nr:zf-HC2 domain-containing protein [Deltaproteobacteria bacterium]MBW2027235.1 zf-HC2 domain-containing protein [Deltaproteobacteria bacterium]MBW2127387.1 zf-HC2 domain-containing protein [Deltaproteobacteria bacterium]